MVESRFNVGDLVQCYKPGHAENGCTGTVTEVLTIEAYGGPAHRGPHAYRCDLWNRGDGFSFGGALPDAMVESAEKRR